MTASGALRVAKYSLLTLIAILLLIATAVTVLLGSERGRLWLVDKGIEQANKAGLDVQIEGLRNPSLGDWHIAELVVEREGEPLLRASDVDLQWRPSALLQREVKVDLLAASELHVYASAAEEETPEPETKESTGLPNLPPVTLNQLRIDEFAFHPPEGQEQIPHFSINGAARLFHDESPLLLELSANALGDASTQLVIDTKALSDNRIQLAGTLTEDAGGWVGGLLKLPETQELDAAFELGIEQLDEAVKVSMESLQLPLGPHQLVASGALEFSPSAKTLAVDELRLAIDGAVQVMRGGYSPEDLWLEAELTQLPLILGQQWLPELESGTLSGSLEGKWAHGLEPKTWPTASAQLVADLIVQGQPLHGEFAGELDNKLLQLAEVHVQAGDAGLIAEGTIDFIGKQNNIKAALNNFSTELLEPWPVPLPENLAVFAPRAEAILTGSLKDPTVALEARATGEYEKRDFEGSVAATGDKSGGIISHLQVQLGEAALKAEGKIDLAGDQNNLTAELSNFDSKVLEGLPVPLPESLRVKTPLAKAHLTGSLQDPTVKLEASANGQYQNQPFAGQIAATGGKTRADIGHLKVASGVARLEAEGLIDWGNQQADLQLEFSRLTEALLNFLPEQTQQNLPDELRFDAAGSAQVSGALKQPDVVADLRVDGRYDLDDETVPFDLTLQGKVNAGPLDVLKMNIAKLQLDLFDERALNVEGTYSQQNMDLHLRMDRLPARALSALGISGITGDAHADLNLTGSLKQPQLSGSIGYEDELQSGLAVGQPPVPVSFEAEFTSGEDSLQMAATFTQASETAGNLTVQIPLAKYLDAISDSAPLPLTARVQGRVDLAVSQLFLANNIHNLGGIITTDLTLGGTLETPLVEGSLRLNEGHYANALTGTSLRQMEVLLKGAGQNVTVEQAQLNTSGGGSVSAAGRINWSEAQRTQDSAIDLTVTARDAQLIERDDMRGAVQGDLSLRGSFQDLWLRGNLDVSPLAIDLDSAIKTSIPTIEVTDLNEERAGEQPEGSILPVVHLDVIVRTDQQAFLRGRGLDTELEGRIRLAGTLSNPEYIGDLRTVRGRLEVLGKTFQLQNGQVRFSNDVIGLNIPGTYEVSGDDEIDEIRVEVYGTADNPKLKLSSTPTALPEDEILSRLLFGRSMKGLGSFQALRLAVALRSLTSGGGGGFDPIASARDALGVDDLTIGGGGGDEGGIGVSVGVGKYISDKVYLELEHSDDPKQPWQGSVQVEVSPRWRLKGGTYDVGGFGGEALWKKDY